jgi:hypothetical protein
MFETKESGRDGEIAVARETARLRQGFGNDAMAA